MKISQQTQTRLIDIKQDALEVKRKLETLHIRLTEHAGMKRKARKLETVIGKLDEWQKAA